MEEEKIKVISKETLEKIVRCFTDGEELGKYASELNAMCANIAFAGMSNVITNQPEEQTTVLILRQIACFVGFLQEFVEINRELIKVCQVEAFTKEELENMNNRE